MKRPQILFVNVVEIRKTVKIQKSFDSRIVNVQIRPYTLLAQLPLKIESESGIQNPANTVPFNFDVIALDRHEAGWLESSLSTMRSEECQEVTT